MAVWKLLVASAAVVVAVVAEHRLIEFHNRLQQTVWVGTQGDPGMPALQGGGFELRPGEKVDVHTGEKWRGRFWGRTNCSFNDQGQGLCDTGDCGRKLKCGGSPGQPPVTIAEINLSGVNGQDFYDISIVDGFNLAMTVETIDKKGSDDKFFCSTTACRADVNGQCPQDLRREVDGRTVGCLSACLRFNTDEYCCRGSYGKPEACDPSKWPINYPALFKNMCPDAYSYAFDDMNGPFMCVKTDYRVIFG